MILKPLGHQQITSLGSAVALTVPAGAQRALMSATGQNVRLRDDGTNPTTSVGIRIVAGTWHPFLYEGDLAAVRVIQEAASATLDVAYYG